MKRNIVVVFVAVCLIGFGSLELSAAQPNLHRHRDGTTILRLTSIPSDRPTGHLPFPEEGPPVVAPDPPSTAPPLEEDSSSGGSSSSSSSSSDSSSSDSSSSGSSNGSSSSGGAGGSSSSATEDDSVSIIDPDLPLGQLPQTGSNRALLMLALGTGGVLIAAFYRKK